ncbi:MAG: acyltransferase, partial [Bacilli bacterium]|nr:acyltransferase [Bacilli bacterium]
MPTITIPKQISDIIFNSRFPLMVMVVLIHAKLSHHQKFEIYNFLEFTISDYLCRVAVPIFYVVSGYLFFVKSNLSFRSLKLKLKRRVHSILIPYLLWNAIVLGILIISELILPSFRSGNTKPI